MFIMFAVYAYRYKYLLKEYCFILGVIYKHTCELQMPVCEQKA